MGVRQARSAVFLTAAVLLWAPSAASASGPLLEEPVAALESALECTPDVDAATVTPVLLVHGTWSDPEESFSWNYLPVLPELGFPTCTVRLPGRALVDHQRSVEYVVHAIRRVAERSGREISVVGHSQGSVHGIYALRFWPDLAEKVEDFVGLAGLYRGTQAADTLCQSRCPPANWQQRRDSRFTAAINVPSNPPGPSYTSIYTQFDIVATPATEVAPLDGASNFLIQDLCPGRPVDHIGILGDAVTYRLVIDALTNPSPADPTRAGVNCVEAIMPGADGSAIPSALATFLASIAATPLDPNNTEGEPPLRCYLDPSCPKTASGTGPSPAASPARCAGKKATLAGTPDGEVIEGTDGPDVIVALGGKDTVLGGDGEDLICGKRGRDRLRGQGGEDKLFGSRGKDRLFGGAAADLLVGGAKGDFLFGGGGKDVLRGGSPDGRPKDALDLCRGGAGKDRLKNCER